MSCFWNARVGWEGAEDSQRKGRGSCMVPLDSGITGQSIPSDWNWDPFCLRSECFDVHYLIPREKQLWEDIKNIKRYLRY